jgi:uncharacterized phiE125 gp8 family phage protein
MILSLKTAPASLPVALNELTEDWLRVNDDSESNLVNALNMACTEVVQKITNRALITQTWEYKLDVFNSEKIELPKPPLRVVNSVKYYDTANALQTLSPSVYEVQKDTIKGYIKLNYGYTWPSTYSRDDAVVIDYSTGYGAADEVPETIKIAIKLLVAHFYENRQPVATGISIAEIPMNISFLLSPYKVHLI